MTTKSITHIALSLALIVVFFFLFRGVSNILNSILIPIVLYINVSKFNWQKLLVLVLTATIFSFLFFIQQIFFLFLYVLLAGLLYRVMNSNRSFFIKLIVLSAGTLTGFIVSINLTDLLLGTKIKEALLAITNGNAIWFLGLIVVEAVIVALSLLSVTPRIEKILKQIK
jgi:hypothetical protein